MKYIYQFMIIIMMSFLGEILNKIIPLPIPASIYGLIILLICLVTKLIKEEQIKETANFLLKIMPVMFIAPGVGIINNFEQLASNIWPFIIVVVLSTIFIMITTGLVSEYLLKKGQDK